MKRILLINFGSLGDLHPYLGMAIILKNAGYDVTLASNRAYLERIEAAGIRARAIGPEVDPTDPEVIRVVMDSIRGPELLHKKYIFPLTEQFIEEALPLAREADLIVTGILGYFVPTLSELSKTPWAMGMLSPIGYWSAVDPPVIPAAPFLRKLKVFGPAFYRQVYRAIFASTKSWSESLQVARKKFGLARQANPMLASTMTSGHMNLALFSKHFAAPQVDWPKDLRQVGFVEYDGPESYLPLKNDLEKFIAEGEAPIFMTLGSTNVLRPGNIFDEFYAAISQTSFRAIICVAPRDILKYREKFQSPNVHVEDRRNKEGSSRHFDGGQLKSS